MPGTITVDEGLRAAGLGRFQFRLFGVFGLVWAADAMQVLAIGFTAPSIAASFGLGVPQALQTGTLFFVGMLVGAFVFGRLADRFGRRPVLIASVLIDAVFGIASAFAPDFAWLLALRFLTGVGVGGTLPVDYTMLAEFLPSDRRGRWLVLLESFWAVGTILLALVSLYAGSLGGEAWRTIFLCTGLPALIGLALRFFVPETPVYLARSGRGEEARRVLQRVANINGSRVTIGVLEPEARAKAPISDLFSAALRRRTVLVLAAWALVSISYYGVFVYLPVRLASEGFGFLRGPEFLVLIALVQLPGYALAAYGVERWGRRPTLIGFLLLSAAGSMLFSLGAAPALVVGSTLLLSFALLGTWGAIYAFTPEIYPTPLRATGMGTAGAMARFGGLLAPSIVAPLMAANFTGALGLLSGLLILAAAAIRMVDVEPRGQSLD